MPEEELQRILDRVNVSMGKDKKEEEPREVVVTSTLSEPEKQIRKLRKKLDQINKIKERLANGEKVEKNQVYRYSVNTKDWE